MALINCPECGKEKVSDTALACPECGFNIKQYYEKIKTQTVSQDDEKEKSLINNNTLIKPKINKKGLIVTAISIALISMLAVIVIFNINHNNSDYETYLNNINNAQLIMTSSAVDAESICDLTSKVWNNSISKKSDTTTNIYCVVSGNFVDFESALNNMDKDSSISQKKKDITTHQAEVFTLMKKLRNPPKELKEAYVAILDLNNTYNTLVDLAVNPSGSYVTYSSNTTNAVSEFIAKCKALQNILPDIKVTTITTTSATKATIPKSTKPSNIELKYGCKVTSMLVTNNVCNATITNGSYDIYDVELSIEFYDKNNNKIGFTMGKRLGDLKANEVRNISVEADREYPSATTATIRMDGTLAKKN